MWLYRQQYPFYGHVLCRCRQTHFWQHPPPLPPHFTKIFVHTCFQFTLFFLFDSSKFRKINRRKFVVREINFVITIFATKPMAKMPPQTRACWLVLRAVSGHQYLVIRNSLVIAEDCIMFSGCITDGETCGHLQGHFNANRVRSTWLHRHLAGDELQEESLLLVHVRPHLAVGLRGRLHTHH